MTYVSVATVGPVFADGPASAPAPSASPADSAPAMTPDRTPLSSEVRNIPLSPPTETQRKKAQALIERACDLQGGLKAYAAARDLHFVLVENDYQDKAAVHTRKSDIRMRLHGTHQYRQELDSAEVMGCDGRRGWHVQHGHVSTSPADSAVAYFTAGTMAFWSEVPFAFTQDGVLAKYLGPLNLGGKDYETILVTFTDSLRAHNTYFCYFEKDTGRFRGFNFTVVEMGKEIPNFSAWYSDPVQAGPLQFASLQRYYRTGDSFLPDFAHPIHEFRKSAFQLDGHVPDSSFAVPARRP